MFNIISIYQSKIFKKSLEYGVMMSLDTGVVDQSTLGKNSYGFVMFWFCQSVLVPIFAAHSINLNLVSCINNSLSEYSSVKLSIYIFCYQCSIRILYSNHHQFHKNIWSESKEPRTKHVGKKRSSNLVFL